MPTMRTLVVTVNPKYRSMITRREGSSLAVFGEQQGHAHSDKTEVNPGTSESAEIPDWPLRFLLILERSECATQYSRRLFWLSRLVG